MIERELYNSELKDRFLNQYEGGTRDNYSYVLSKAYNLETRFQKDLCEFNDEELDILLSTLEAKSYQSIMYQVSVINNYIQFGIEEGYSKAKINFMNMPKFSGENLKTYIDQIWTEQKILTPKDIEDLIGDCENYQDRVVFSLLYEGIMGEEMDEIRSLKISDINSSNNTLTITRNGEKQIIKVSPDCIDVCKNAHDETDYWKNNQDTTSRSKSLPLMDTEYIVKPVKKRNIEEGKASYNAVRQRFTRIKNWWGNPYLTPTSIRTSGMITYAKALMEKYNITELEREHFEEINKRFGMNENLWFHTKTKILPHLQGE